MTVYAWCLAGLNLVLAITTVAGFVSALEMHCQLRSLRKSEPLMTVTITARGPEGE